MPIIINTPSIPTPMYLSEFTKFIGSNIYITSVYIKNPRTRAPAITDAICPDTLTPIACIRRKF